MFARLIIYNLAWLVSDSSGSNLMWSHEGLKLLSMKHEQDWFRAMDQSSYEMEIEANVDSFSQSE